MKIMISIDNGFTNSNLPLKFLESSLQTSSKFGLTDFTFGKTCLRKNLLQSFSSPELVNSKVNDFVFPQTSFVSFVRRSAFQTKSLLRGCKK